MAGTKLRTTASIFGKTLDLFLYRPEMPPLGILFVFHGTQRTAESYRNAAIPLADKQGLVIYAPLFDEARFPTSKYQMGGVTTGGTTTGRTVDMVAPLIDFALKAEGPSLPVYLFGHSAGGQFLSRVAAYTPQQKARRIIIANPSSHVMPSVQENAPYGFDIMNDDRLSTLENDLLIAYLAKPVTIFLGMQDTGTDDLSTAGAAVRQGKNRLDRGLNVFDFAARFASEKKYQFGWRLSLANGIGHAGGEMMRSPEMLDAMGLAR